MVHKSKKKSHKSASSKKSKKERDHKKKRSHGDRATDNDDGCPLGDALTQALLTCPKLLEELPQMALALDKGEFINLEGISNVPMRESLIQVFNNIPIVSKDNTGQGWYRNTKDKRITSYIMNSLTGCKVIRDPRKLDSSQSTTSRIPAIHLLSLVQQFPNIVSELPVIIDQILEGNAVALENIADEDLGEALEKLLKSLGLVQTRDGLDIPSGREGDHVVDCLEHFEEIFKAYERGNYRLSSSNEGKTRYDSDSDRSSSSSESQHSYCSSSSSSSSRNKASHEIIEDDESGDEIGPSIKVAGPSMPTKRELEKAQLLMENYQKTHGISSDEEDDEFGPKLRTDGHVDVSNNSMPLGYLGIEMPKATVDSRVIDQLIPVVEKREEWLLTPGESKSLAGKYLSCVIMKNSITRSCLLQI